MFCKFRSVLPLFVAAILCTTATVADDFKIEDGFTPMFNGKDFSGWQFGKTYGLPEPAPKDVMALDEESLSQLRALGYEVGEPEDVPAP